MAIKYNRRPNTQRNNKKRSVKRRRNVGRKIKGGCDCSKDIDGILPSIGGMSGGSSAGTIKGGNGFVIPPTITYNAGDPTYNQIGDYGGATAPPPPLDARQSGGKKRRPTLKSKSHNNNTHKKRNRIQRRRHSQRGGDFLGFLTANASNIYPVNNVNDLLSTGGEKLNNVL